MKEIHEKSRGDRSELSLSPASLSAPIVGRQKELALIMNHYQAAKAGRAEVVVLTGEPGIGKTRLLDEIALQCAQDGAVVLHGNASEAEGMPPFLPFLEALGRYIRATPQDQIRTQVATLPQMLVSLLPELAVYLPDLHIPQPLLPEQSKFRLYEAIGSFLESINTSHPLVIIIDNLQWADSASLDLLCHLTYHQSNAYLFILGAYREGEVARTPVVARTLVELSHQRALTTVIIPPLSTAEIGMLASGRYGGSLSGGVHALLYAQSEGNPFFAEELLGGWIESGALKLENQEWVTVAPLDSMLPPTIAGALRQRFAQLAPAIIDHLRVAAIIGRSFDPSLLATVEEQEIEAVEECLLEAARARLVRVDNQGRCLFSHDKIRECLYTEVSTSRRRRLHERIGHVLETHYGTEDTLSMHQLADLAFHFARGGDPARGVDYSLRAAAQALQTAAAEEAMSYYRTALELLNPHDGGWGDVLLDLGDAALLAGKEQEAETIYEAARRWLLQQSEQNDGVRAARAVRGLGLALWRQEKLQAAHKTLEYALAFFGNGHRVEKVKILADLSELLIVSMGQYDEGMAYAQQALGMARKVGETELELRVGRIIIGNLSFQGSDLSSAVQSLEQLLARSEERGDLAEAGECCLNLAIAYYWAAEIRRSYEVSLHRTALIERARQPYQLRTVYIWPILLLASQGRWAEAEQEIERARSSVEQLASLKPYAVLRQFQGFLAYQREDYAIAERELEAALKVRNRQRNLDDTMLYLGLLGLVQATLGNRKRALDSIAHLKCTLELLPADILPTAPVRVCLALAFIALGDHEQARNLYTPLLAFRGQHYWFLVDRVLGLLATLSGEWETAAMHLAAAEAIARRERLRPELARTLLGQAKVALGQGGQASASQAMRLLNEALVLFEQLGMADSAQRVRHRLQSLAHQPSAPKHLPALPANLTQREAAVLNLVVSGKSNGQIAQELVISEKTVINHLTHIFNKTNTENRVTATAFAIRHGLA